RCLRGRLRFFGDIAGLLAAGRHHALRGSLRPQARFALFGVALVALEFRVDPAALVQARGGHEGGVHFPVVARHECPDARFAFGHDGQRGRLYAPHGRLEETAVFAVEGRHGARAVDADQPVGLGTRARGRFKRLELFVVAQVLERFADRGLRHGLQPQAAYGLLYAGILDDVAEDQLALSARVTGVDQGIDIFALGQLDQQLQAFGRALVRRPQLEFRR